MPDREKVIKGLYLCEWTSAGRYDGYEPDYESCLKCPYRQDDLEPDVCCADLMRDALELLKEQESVVRCKDCKNAYILPWLDNAIICKKHNYTGVRPEEFYCADGERR